MKNIRYIVRLTATALAVAFVVYSCNRKLEESQKENIQGKPVQVVSNMFVVQTENGSLKMRMEADRMERYETDTLSFELFPEGLSVFSYEETGKLESTIFADQARHLKFKDGREDWQAFGNVHIRNEIKNETMITDTIYWDRENELIYTDCYVKMFSKDGMMQGYGMRSDQRANNTILLKPFDGYGVVVQDSTKVIIDTANFIGPLRKK